MKAIPRRSWLAALTLGLPTVCPCLAQDDRSADQGKSDLKVRAATQRVLRLQIEKLRLLVPKLDGEEMSDEKRAELYGDIEQACLRIAELVRLRDQKKNPKNLQIIEMLELEMLELEVMQQQADLGKLIEKKRQLKHDTLIAWLSADIERKKAVIARLKKRIEKLKE